MPMFVLSVVNSSRSKAARAGDVTAALLRMHVRHLDLEVPNPVLADVIFEGMWESIADSLVVEDIGFGKRVGQTNGVTNVHRQPR